MLFYFLQIQQLSLCLKEFTFSFNELGILSNHANRYREMEIGTEVFVGESPLEIGEWSNPCITKTSILFLPSQPLCLLNYSQYPLMIWPVSSVSRSLTNPNGLDQILHWTPAWCSICIKFKCHSNLGWACLIIFCCMVLAHRAQIVPPETYCL